VKKRSKYFLRTRSKAVNIIITPAIPAGHPATIEIVVPFDAHVINWEKHKQESEAAQVSYKIKRSQEEYICIVVGDRLVPLQRCEVWPTNLKVSGSVSDHWRQQRGDSFSQTNYYLFSLMYLGVVSCK
jgi:hypothetical protein